MHTPSEKILQEEIVALKAEVERKQKAINCLAPFLLHTIELSQDIVTRFQNSGDPEEMEIAENWYNTLDKLSDALTLAERKKCKYNSSTEPNECEAL